MKNIAGSDLDPLDWARRPRSEIAMRAVFTLANSEHDRERFRPIADKLVADGRADEQGNAQFVWRGFEWARP